MYGDSSSLQSKGKLTDADKLEIQTDQARTKILRVLTVVMSGVMRAVYTQTSPVITPRVAKVCCVFDSVLQNKR